MAPFKVVIAGGGLCGALLANGLMNHGVDVTIYERDAADSVREGYQIRLGESANKGFDACLAKERRDAIHNKLGKSSSSAATAPTICSTRFDTILDLTKSSSYSKSAAMNRVVLRNILIEPIVDAGRVNYGKSLTRYEISRTTHGDEQATLHFADGSTDTCDLLIGADGSSSKVNAQVGARNLVEIESHMMVLNKGSLSISRIKSLPAKLLDGPVLTFAGQRSFFCALYLPESHPQNGVSTDADAEHILDEASFYWGIVVPRAEYPSDRKLDSKDRLQFCLEQTKTWAPEYRSMINCGAEDGQTDNIIAAPLRASNKLPRTWRDKLRQKAGADPAEGHPRIWLIGDAIHAMQPNRGMGGNQALQDCADALPQILRLNEMHNSGRPPSTEEIKQALDVFEASMLERTFKWVQKSGGSSILNLDFDGVLGTLVKFLGMMLVPMLNLWSNLGSKKKQE